MQAIHIVASAAQKNIEGICLFTRPAENHRLADIFGVDQANDRIRSLAVFNHIEQLLNIVVGGLMHCSCDLDRVMQNRLRQSHDRARHRR